MSPVVLGFLIAFVTGVFPFNQFSSSNIDVPAAVSVLLTIISLPFAPGLILSLVITNMHDPNIVVAFALNWVFYAALFYFWQRRRLKRAI